MKAVTSFATIAVAVAVGACSMEPEPVDEVDTGEVSSAVTTTGERSVRLDRSLIAGAGEEAFDLDGDGLHDVQEGQLAHAFRPYLRFDSGERAREPYEPLTVFQVRPQSYRGLNLTVRIEYVLLFERDGGYGGSSWCDDSHPGDNDDLWIEARSTNGGRDWTITRVHLSFKNLEWPTNQAMTLQASTHPVIYVSGSKHHEYFSTAWDGKNSYYSDWGCNENVDGRGAAFYANASGLWVASGYRNNVGEPERHPASHFVDSLAAFWPGESIWGGDRFFDLDPNRDKFSTLPRPVDLGHLAPAPAALWTSYTSDETATHLPLACPNGHAIRGVQCHGRYCDDIRAYCVASGRSASAVSWTSWFSEEGASSRVCAGGVVTGLECSGKYCDNLRLECTTLAGATPHACSWSAEVSDEQGATTFPAGTYVAGVRCSGSYCDNKSFYLCSL
ncbi:MAG: hypothetical protein H6708_34520 [Kofleriaceae bacterium]|nr:hypothetical protein [Kofleriaceae bacterium]